MFRIDPSCRANSASCSTSILSASARRRAASSCCLSAWSFASLCFRTFLQVLRRKRRLSKSSYFSVGETTTSLRKKTVFEHVFSHCRRVLRTLLLVFHEHPCLVWACSGLHAFAKSIHRRIWRRDWSLCLDRYSKDHSNRTPPLNLPYLPDPPHTNSYFHCLYSYLDLLQ